MNHPETVDLCYKGEFSSELLKKYKKSCTEYNKEHMTISNEIFYKCM